MYFMPIVYLQCNDELLAMLSASNGMMLIRDPVDACRRHKEDSKTFFYLHVQRRTELASFPGSSPVLLSYTVLCTVCDKKLGRSLGTRLGLNCYCKSCSLLAGQGRWDKVPCAHGIIHMYKQTMVQGSIPTSLLSSHLSTVD